MRRAIILASLLGGSVGVAWGCGESLDDLLLDALCDTDDDCAPGQKCEPNYYQTQAGGQGWCRNDSSCAVGAQPGCACSQMGAERDCVGTTEPGVIPSEQSDNCFCLYACNESQWEGGCPGFLVPSNLEDADCKCELPQP